LSRSLSVISKTGAFNYMAFVDKEQQPVMILPFV